MPNDTVVFSPVNNTSLERVSGAAEVVSRSPDTKHSRSPLEKKRIAISWISCFGVCFLLVVTKSQWPVAGLMSGTMLLAGLAMAFVGCIGRIWCSLYINGSKTRTLVTCGPYSVCRNPLYFFSAVGAAGVALGTVTFTVPAVVVVCFGLFYSIIIRSEERRLEVIHGTAFAEYRDKVPVFFPQWNSLFTPETYRIHTQMVGQSMLEATWFFWFTLLAHLIYQLHQRTDFLPTLFVSP